MAKKLFQTASELLEGYGLNENRYKTRRVNLVGKPLPSGKVSLIKYGRSNGKRFRVSTGTVLECETNLNIKRANEEKVRLQRIQCDAENADLERTNVGFEPAPKSNAKFIDFLQALAEAEYERTKNKHSYYYNLKALSQHIIAYDNANVEFRDITVDWIVGFVEYLRNDAVNFNYQRTPKEDNRKSVHISQNSQCRLQRNLNFALNKAVKAKIISSNPMRGLDADDKVKPVSGTRNFLSKEEIRTLINTPYTHGRHDIKESFLFACYTGLRFSDLKAVAMKDFHRDENGIYLRIIMQKTKEPLKIYIPKVSMSLIPTRESDSIPIFNLPKNDHANRNLQKWLKDAGITDRNITFHSARHTAATLLLSNEIPIAVVSKQLGHLKISTTEIYAKIIDEAQKSAATKMDDLFM